MCIRDSSITETVDDKETQIIYFSSASMLSSQIAVSYTHLDVYKRQGLETVVFTVSVDSIAMMPCNPNIGGTSKGHLVKEIDALGGEMGKNIDKTFIQSKMLNQSCLLYTSRCV